jgi:predicted DCC family thiol-disulfide oxidoreductase YuxK
MRNAWTGGQYSLFRTLLGLYLCIHFAHLLPWAAELFSNEGVLPDAELSPVFAAFPNLYAISDAPWFVHASLTLASLAGLAFACGWRDRVAAVFMWVVLASLYGRNPLIANPSFPYVGFMLIAHLLVAPAPYGSNAARGRDDLAVDWRLSPAVFLAAWVVLAISYSYSGYTKLLSPSWVAGNNIAYVLDNPLARDWFLRDFMLWLPTFLISALTWTVLYLELLFAPVALWAPARAWLWAGMLFVQCGFLFLLNFADLTIGMLLFHLFTFDPAWVRARGFAAGATLYYDGTCALCHGTVRFLLAEERSGVLRFAPLQGAMFQKAVSVERRAGLPDSIVLDLRDGELRTRSVAVVAILQRMGGLWTLLGWLLWAIPRPLRDLGYDAVGAVRIRVFGRAEGLCPMVTPKLAQRLLAD